MENKSANQPGSGQGNTRNNQGDPSQRSRNNKASQQGGNNSHNGRKFTGLDKGMMSGIVITDTSNIPTSQQFDTFCEAIIECGGSQNPMVRTSPQTPQKADKDKMKPPKPDKSEYTDQGNEDKEVKEALMSIWASEATALNKKHDKHIDELKKAFSIVMGQLGQEVKNNLTMDAQWKKTNEENDALGLINMLRELCHRDNNTKAMPVRDSIHKMAKLLSFKQEPNKTSASYVEESKTKFDVLKSIGGSIVSKQAIECTSSKVEPCATAGKTHSDCTKMDETDRKQVIAAVDDIVLATAIIEGCNSQTHRNLSQFLADQCTLGQDQHPTTAGKARELLGQHKVKNAPRNNKSRRNDGNKEKSSAKEEKSSDHDRTMLTTVDKNSAEKAEKPDTKDEPKTPTEHAHQLLLNAADDFGGEDDEFMFTQIDTESTYDDDSWSLHCEDPDDFADDEAFVFVTTDGKAHQENDPPGFDPTEWDEDGTCANNAHSKQIALIDEEDTWSQDDESSYSNLSADTFSSISTDADDAQTTPCVENASQDTDKSGSKEDDMPEGTNDRIRPTDNARSADTTSNKAARCTDTHGRFAGGHGKAFQQVLNDEIERLSRALESHKRRPETHQCVFGMKTSEAKIRSRVIARAHQDALADRCLVDSIEHTHPRNTAKKDATVDALPSVETDMTDACVLAQRSGGSINPCWILLDSQATCNVMCNKAPVRSIRPHPDGKKITIHCDAGSVEANTIADLPGFGTVWFYPDGIANCPSSSLASNTHRATLDTEVTQAFFVHKQDGSTGRFDRVGCNLHACDMRKTDGHVLNVTTVEGQKKFYSDLDIRRAKKARKLQEVTGFPGLKAFLDMTDNNKILNCPVTRRDIAIAQDICGDNTNMTKGKTVRRQPGHVREDIAPLPPDMLKRCGKVTLSIDVCHLNNQKFFRSISRHIKFRTTRCIKDASANALFACVKATCGQCAARGFQIVQMHGDNEFSCVRDRLATESNVVFHPAAAGSHEPHVERDDRTSEERARCTCAALPFKRLPPRMVIEMIVGIDFWLNHWCSSGGTSQTISPRETLTGIKLDASKHCRFQFGDCVLAHDESDNSLKPRASDAMHLRPTGSASGGFCVFDLETARRVHRRSASPAHMTQTIIDRVKAVALSQSAPIGLIFADHKNNSTMLDVETPRGQGNTDPEDDDDDASDQDCTPDDESTHTDLAGVATDDDDSTIEEAGINRGQTDPGHPATMGEEPTNNTGSIEDHSDEAGNGEDGNVDNVSTHDAEDDLCNGDHGLQDESIEMIFEPDDSSMTSATDTGHTNVDHPAADVEPENEEQSVGQCNLRPSVARAHNKFSRSDGFETSTHHRVPFSQSFNSGIAKLEREDDRFMMVSSAVEQCHHLEASQVTPQCGVNKGIKMFGEAGVEAALKELKQLHDRKVIAPCNPRHMTRDEVKRALPHLVFLKRKRCGKMKGRGCADGRPQREFINREDASSPTVNPHAPILTCMIDSLEQRDVATADIPGALLQTDMPKDEVVHIRLDGAMAELLCKLDPDLYEPCMIVRKRKLRNGKIKESKALHSRANKAICGTLRAAPLFWENLSGKLQEWGFVLNPCDRCTANKIINGKQCAIVWHVDDLKISHEDGNVVSDVLRRLQDECGKTTPLAAARGKKHECLGMTIDFSAQSKVRLTMMDCLEDVIATPPENLKTNRNTATPAGEHPFDVNPNAEKLGEREAAQFHHCVAKLLFAAKRARPDLQTAVAFLCTRVKSPDVDDQKKLIRVLGCLRDTIFLPLVLGSDGTGNAHWHVDAAFAVHDDMKSHTGGVLTFGAGAATSMSLKQKTNTESSTEAELAGVDDVLPFNVWCFHFLRSQGCHAANEPLPQNNEGSLKRMGHTSIPHQDSTSSIRLETNGKASSTKRTERATSI